MFDIDTALRTLVEREGSDLHVKVAAPPIVRLHGELTHLEGYQPLSAEDTEKAFHDIAEVRSLTEFEEDGEADFSYSIPSLSRFRVNAFKQRGSISIVCRAIPFEIRSVEELGLPEVVTAPRRGAARDHPRHRHHRLGQEHDAGGDDRPHQPDPGAPHRHARGPDRVPAPRQTLDRQPARGRLGHRVSFARAMRRVLRQDPDVILIGEMRDEETVRTALSAAETGHLVLSTVHTLDATETINRIIDFFPPHLQQQARVMLVLDPEGRDRPAPRPRRHRRRPGRRLRGPGRHRPRPGPDPQSRRNGQDHRGDRRGRVLRDAHLRPVAARAT